MSRYIARENGTCPCKCCQAAIARTPAQKAIAKIRRLGQTLPRWAKNVREPA